MHTDPDFGRELPGRENADPYEKHNPVPRLVLGVVAGLVIWAIGYIWTQRADGLAELGDRRDPATLTQAAGGSARVADGKQLYAANCQACHQATGQGLPGVFPPLAGSPFVTGDAELPTQILLHGLTGPVEVLGATYNGAMPAFGEQLGDAEIAALLTHIRTEWGNGAPAVDAAAVAAARKAAESRKTPWRVEELPKPTGKT
jgi:mono/diheme cytochrome c family protein